MDYSGQDDAEEQLFALDKEDYVLVESAGIGKGDLFTKPHVCEVPEHNTIMNIQVLTIVFFDYDKKPYTVAIPFASPLGKALLDMDFYYQIKHVVEN